MAIESNDKAPSGQNNAGAPQPSVHTTFDSSSSTTSAIGGSNDFVSMSNRIGIVRNDPTVDPYLEKLMELVKANLSNAQLIRLQDFNNTFAIRHDGKDGMPSFFAIGFVSLSDQVGQDYYPASARLGVVAAEIKRLMGNKPYRFVDARIILSGVPADMDRVDRMADTVVRTFQVTSDPEIKNAQSVIMGGTEFVIDWRLDEARAVENSMSPHGVRPRMDVGFTIKAKVVNKLGREFRELESDYRVVGVIGGYTEIRDKERFLVGNHYEERFRPIFNITVALAVIPLEGIVAVLLAILAPQIYNTKFWATQWNNFGDNQPHPGLLREDPDNRGRPTQLADKSDLLAFIEAFFAPPEIAFQFQDGRDGIPGMWRLGSDSAKDRDEFLSRLNHFFGTEGSDQNFNLGSSIQTRYEGVFGDRGGELHDSREIDYLEIAAKNGFGSIDSDARKILLSGAGTATDRAKLVSYATNSFSPIWRTSVFAVNPDFFRWVVARTDRARLNLVDPSSGQESRSLGSWISDFGSSSGIGSVVSSGNQNRGLNLGSYRQY